jgi:sulfur carrier protein
VIMLNGKPADGGGATIEELLGQLDVPAEGRGVAVAVDAEVVPRSEWRAFVVPDGAAVEVVTAVQGG